MFELTLTLDSVMQRKKVFFLGRKKVFTGAAQWVNTSNQQRNRFWLDTSSWKQEARWPENFLFLSHFILLASTPESPFNDGERSGKGPPWCVTAPSFQSSARSPRQGGGSAIRTARPISRQKLGRHCGHQGHKNTQMVTQRPISCCPITKEVLCSLLPPLPPHSFLPVPPPPLPLLSIRRENRRCWDCIIAPITVIIYTSILSYSLFFFVCSCNQSLQVWSAQLRHARQCRYSFQDQRLLQPSDIYLVWKSLGKFKAGRELH